MSLVDFLQYSNCSSLYIDFIFSLKSQINDAEGLGGKLSEDDKDTILSAIKEKTGWLDEHPQADAEDYEEQLSELQATVAVSVILFDIFFVANEKVKPITSNLYGGASGSSYDDEQMPFSHDEL